MSIKQAIMIYAGVMTISVIGLKIAQRYVDKVEAEIEEIIKETNEKINEKKVVWLEPEEEFDENLRRYLQSEDSF